MLVLARDMPYTQYTPPIITVTLTIIASNATLPANISLILVITILVTNKLPLLAKMLA